MREKFGDFRSGKAIAVCRAGEAGGGQKWGEFGEERPDAGGGIETAEGEAERGFP